MDAKTKSSYPDVYARWQRDPEGFWADAAKEIDWFEPAQKVFDPAQGIYGRWFAGAVCNTCWNALDRHVANGRGDQPALIYDSPVTGVVASYSYKDMLFEVSTLAAVLQDFGVKKGDRVIL
jgi:propionyl-CoA synthetase